MTWYFLGAYTLKDRLGVARFCIATVDMGHVVAALLPRLWSTLLRRLSLETRSIPLHLPAQPHFPPIFGEATL